MPNSGRRGARASRKRSSTGARSKRWWTGGRPDEPPRLDTWHPGRMTATFNETVEGDLLAVSFRVRVDGETAPGAAWMPADLDEPAPLVFLQHPLMSSKDDYFVADTA